MAMRARQRSAGAVAILINLLCGIRVQEDNTDHIYYQSLLEASWAS
jgi:hypothetical protein